MMKSMHKSNLREGSRVCFSSFMEGKMRQQECEIAAHILSVVKKRTIPVCLTFSICMIRVPPFKDWSSHLS